MWITYSLLSCKLATSFSTFSVFSLSGKKGNHYEAHVISQDTEHQIQENFLHPFFIIIFYEIFIKLRSIFYPFKILYWKLLRHCPTIRIIYIPILKIWWFFIFIVIFHVFVITFCISINRVTYCSSNISFYH